MTERNEKRTMRAWPPWVVWLLAIAVTVGAIVYDADTREGGGISEALVATLLLILALALPWSRRMLRRAATLKTPLFEVGLNSATEEAIERLRNALHTGQEGESNRALQIIRSDEQSKAVTSLEMLRDKLRQRIDWISAELFAGALPSDYLAAVGKLDCDLLLDSDSRTLAEFLLTLDTDDMRVISQATEASDTVRQFLKIADRAVNQFRLIVFDRKVRRVLRDKEFTLFDWEGQPIGRWPDFLAHRPGRTLRISPRMATDPESDLYTKTRKRLKGKKAATEVPGTTPLDSLIVVPNSSRTQLGTHGHVTGVKLEKLSEYL